MAKAITLHQPWATLIALGNKRYETRSWPTRHRGLLLIHAGKAEDRHMTMAAHRNGWLPALEILPMGAIVAACEVSAMIRAEDLASEIDHMESCVGDFSPGRWAWEIQAVRPLAVPISCRGFQGLWTPPAEVWEAVQQQLSEVNDA